MKEKKIIQVGIVVKDLEKMVKQYNDFFGAGPWDIYEYGPPRMTEGTYMGKPADWSAVIGFCQTGDVQLELIQPLKGPNIYFDHLENKGEGLHHIKERFDNCQEVVEEYRKKGVSMIQSGKFSGGEFYYFDTVPFLGILYEISKKGVKKSIGPDRTYPE